MTLGELPTLEFLPSHHLLEVLPHGNYLKIFFPIGLESGMLEFLIRKQLSRLYHLRFSSSSSFTSIAWRQGLKIR